ncbi:lysophospholipase [Maioricimonas sp. JC845]|uniref:alpha/beta hydrolase n=1 Tax=Maioricimonas sp. JC845 TaxID=3232138 RepID=UPI00345AD141
MDLQTVTVTDADGTTDLFVRIYGDKKQLQRTLVIIHGAGEHGGRYDHFAGRILGAGWRVLALDLRGHGQSGGVPTHVEQFEHYLRDLDTIWNHFQLDPESTAVFGHSMGGLVSVRYAETRPQNMSALVLSAPLLGLAVKVPLLKEALGRICALVAPRTRFLTEIQPDQLTRNPEALERRDQDPFSNRTVTAAWYFQMIDAMYQAWHDADRIHCPLLLLQGQADEIVDPNAAIGWWLRLASTDRTLQLFPEHLHELINEPDWEQTATRILEWLDARMPAQPRTPMRSSSQHVPPQQPVSRNGS